MSRQEMKAADKTASGLIGLKVREARMQAAMTQEALGVALDVSFQQIQKYEKGVNRVSTPALVKIAAATNKPLSFFTGVIEADATPEDVERMSFLASPNGHRLITAAMKSHPLIVTAIINLLEQHNGL